MPEFRTEPLVVPTVSGLLPEGERERRVALTSFHPAPEAKPVPLREVRCYECGKRSSVPASALSANCIHCHTHLNMADVEIKPGTRRLTIRTVGNVTAPADVVLSHMNIQCDNLDVYGRISGTLSCSGRLRFANTMRVEGRVRAAEMLVEKGADIVLSDGGEFREVTVAGRLTGVIRARKVHILRGGELNGTCSAEQIEVQPGGINRSARA